MDLARLGLNIMRVLSEKGISQGDVAKKTGGHKSKISKYLNGHHKMPVDAFLYIVEMTEEPLSEFTEGVIKYNFGRSEQKESIAAEPPELYKLDIVKKIESLEADLKNHQRMIKLLQRQLADRPEFNKE